MGLLVLTRKQLETVIIDVDGEMIEVIIAEIRRDKVKLGIRASDKVQINRPEIREKKLKNAEKDGVSLSIVFKSGTQSEPKNQSWLVRS